MGITLCTNADFDQIMVDFHEFWDHDRTVALHHPTITNEFGNTAFVIKEGDKVIAYLFGFFSQTGQYTIDRLSQKHRHDAIRHRSGRGRARGQGLQRPRQAPCGLYQGDRVTVIANAVKQSL